MRRLLLIAAAVLVTTTPASAATLEHTASTGPAEEDYLDYHAGKGEKNVVTVTIKKRDLIVTDPGATIVRKKGDFGGCKFLTKHKALCKKMADLPFLAELGNQSDSFRVKGIKNHLGTSDPELITDLGRLPDISEDDEGAIGAASIIDAGPGNDSISGTGGHDVLEPGIGRDTVDGGDGDDDIVVAPDKSNDRLLGGRGVDTIDVSGKRAVTIDLDANELTAGSEDDLLDGFERAHGGDGNDTLIGSAGTDGLVGGGGSDTIEGGAGDDVLDARDTDADALDCGDGNDVILAGSEDLVTGCESSASGVFTGSALDQSFDVKALATVAPVARGADGAPTYSIACSQACDGTLALASPVGDVLGSAPFTIAAGAKTDVAVVLTDAGKAALAQPGARASVHVNGTGVDYGWQQQLGP
jgi:Ca2+-binding RTX toxin-like protein